ncbi:tetratricopeptide repeat protein 32 [Nerophis ophidion]|uniref:tetratricopeptide repeat protein 32 n=1 Tax=Nerophis ophidion TaxID=159077 RepID=UPI002ADF6A4F|nr:tetratricopeptide repeat protein 32 [Nerophis ophidion]
MAEEHLKTFRAANFEFDKQNFKRAEELYNIFIPACAQSRECDAAYLATAYNNRGQIKYFRVDFNEAMEDYTAAIQADGQFEVPFYNRGLIHYRLGFFDNAIRDFQQALKLKEDFEDAKVGLQRTLLDQRDKIKRGY